jgi:putative oxidoreductase
VGCIVKFIFLLGRVLFSFLFIIKSLEHFSPKMVTMAEGMGVPMAQFLVPASGIVALLGGLSILLGYKAKIGAWLLVIFLLPATFFMHTYWSAENSFAAMMHHYCFWKNIALLGASLMITYAGSGPMSLKK